MWFTQSGRYFNMNVKNIIISVLLILTIFISSCNINNKNNPQPIGSTSTSSIGAINGVQVENPAFPERRVVGNAENIELPNCFGSADLDSHIRNPDHNHQYNKRRVYSDYFYGS